MSNAKREIQYIVQRELTRLKNLGCLEGEGELDALLTLAKTAAVADALTDVRDEDTAVDTADLEKALRG